MPNWAAIFDGKSKVAKRNAVLAVALVGLAHAFNAPGWLIALLSNVVP